MKRKPLIAGNWKMNMTWTSGVRLAQTVVDNTEGSFGGMQIVMCPPFTCIKGVDNVLAFDRSEVMVGAQDVHEEMPQGTAACTGEVSVAMLKDLECQFCIVGHSERRAANGETDQLVNRKAKLLLDNDIVPIICVGESAEVNAAGQQQAQQFVCAQVRAALQGFTAQQAAKVVIAYEPIWAIGTGNVPSPEGADAMCAAVRQTAAEVCGSPDVADAIRVLYGGSMNPQNAEYFLAMPNIDGGLIGGASLDAAKFVEIVRICDKLKRA